MNTEFKNINNPDIATSLKHLDEIYENAKLALINGNPIILIQSIDLGENYLNQDLFNEVNRDVKNGFINYSNKMISRFKHIK